MGSVNEIPPPDFDWVTARHQCSADTVFNHLRLLAKDNVETRNAQATDMAGFTATNGSFSVWSKAGLPHERHAVDFALDGKTITVRGYAEFRITLTLNNQGLCKCKVGTEELDPWQVLKKALEPILFMP